MPGKLGLMYVRHREEVMHNIGLFGAARIAPQAIIEPASRREDVTILGVASASGKAGDFAREHGIARVHDSYDAMLADADIDIIYNALPGHMHGPMTIAALEAGKHVLCEKPFAMNAAEARRMIAAGEAAGRIVMEAFHNHHHPAVLKLVDLRASGRLGEITSVRSVFNAHLKYTPTELRHKWEMGGGAFMDLGCYALHMARSFMGEEPELVSAEGRKSESGVDEAISARLHFPSGADALVSTSMAKGVEIYWTFEAEGSRGHVRFVNFVKPHEGHTIVEVIDGVKREYTVGGGTTYDYQLDTLVKAIDTGAPLLIDGADTLANMSLIDAIYAKAGFPPR
jgi:predicted dehydrogenase